MPIVGTIREHLVATREDGIIDFEPGRSLCPDDAGAWLWDVLPSQLHMAWEVHVATAAARLTEWRRGDVRQPQNRKDLFDYARRSNPA